MTRTTTRTDLVLTIQTRANDQRRVLIAISGAPGSGKTTLARDLVNRLGPTAAVLPMDGFHLDNTRLHQLGLFDRKGAPETFDASGFVALMRCLRDTPQILFPTFDRKTDATIANAGRIDARTRIVLVEGNYLLLDTPPWNSLDALFDLTVQLDVPRQVLEHRLITRWRDHGLSETAARSRAQGNDMRNVDTVLTRSRQADLILAAS